MRPMRFGLTLRSRTESKAEKATDWLMIGAFWVVYLWPMRHLPLSILSSLPATGGDTGSHYWPVVVLREYGLPNFDWRVWNPGNYLGEPLLVHYFPLPFLLMSMASYFMPAGLAFNLGTVLPYVALPLAIFWSVPHLCRGLGASATISRRAGALSGILASGVLYNDGNSMWGGNVKSLLAGQFAHMYALVFFFLFLGVLPKALSKHGPWRTAGLLFCAVVISHAYVALLLPVVFVSILFLMPTLDFTARLKRLVLVGLAGTLLSAWFWWPMIDNAKWTTPYSLEWQFENYIMEILPVTMAPAIVLVITGLLYFLLSRSLTVSCWRLFAFWGLICITGVVYYANFSKFGLVDVRAIPQSHYALACLAAVFVAAASVQPRLLTRILVTVTVVMMTLWQISLNELGMSVVKGWFEHNYSGWTNQPASESLRELTQGIAGSFDDPRVSFEHAGDSHLAGTERVFELLPFFSRRSVTDGLYMQSSVLAPLLFFHQSLISKSPSCPYEGYPCGTPDLGKALRLGRLLGVGTYLLNTGDLTNKAAQMPEMIKTLVAKPWTVYQDSHKTSFVEVPRIPVKLIASEGWRGRFSAWFESYSESDPFLVVEPAGVAGTDLRALVLPSSNALMSDCATGVHVEFGRIRLETECPGKFHVLKFSYHGSWRADSGDQTWLTSPGFIGIVPSQKIVNLRFGQTASWHLATWISLAVLAAMILANIEFKGLSSLVLCRLR